MKRKKKIAGEPDLTLETWATPGLIFGVERELCVKGPGIPSKWYEEKLLDQKYPATFVGYFNQCTTHYILPFATASLVAASVVCLKAFQSSTPRGSSPYLLTRFIKTI